MQQGIHPQYVGTTISCACGNKIETGSTKGDFKIDVCSACHPFYTGKARQQTVAGRIDQFNKRYKRK